MKEDNVEFIIDKMEELMAEAMDENDKVLKEKFFKELRSIVSNLEKKAE